ncbi:Gfo/Idh/MocA family protein [Desmospora activa]|uniref:Putative dehydrogenase n=1 Tax=Desmospora activa DSM 45169 TaxID=1121389 RepID=A0A2T4Z4C9_9BACL|nr:Gfo/Idh/MocA family oxidoreductase [Desmospora activa]PTM56725.1 putative dehydrogenase [Desmospora activa DSM 45169]
MVQYAIVGCGHIANKHVEAIEAAEGAKLSAVCDRDPRRLEPFAAKGIHSFTDMERMITSVTVDVVNICTPSGLHAPLAIQAANAGKHVVVEKPMALTLKDADAILQACERNGVQLAVVHPNRFRPVMKALRQRVDEGAFGSFSHANATVRWNRNQEYYNQAPWRGSRAMDGGVLMNQAIHNLDLMLWLMGDVEEVSAYQATRFRQIEAEDVSVSVLRFASGALGVIEAAVTLYPRNLEESLALFGETGTAVVSGPTANWIQTWKFADQTDEDSEQTIHRIHEDPQGLPGHSAIIRDMTAAVREGRRPVVNGEDGRKALELVIACQRAAELGRPVRLSELRRDVNQGGAS